MYVPLFVLVALSTEISYTVITGHCHVRVRRKEIFFMILNPDCIRDILIYVEENTNLQRIVSISPKSLPDELSKYTGNEVMYHIKQAELSSLLNVASWYLDGGCSIYYLLPEGHQFLADIREDNNWNKTKDIAKSVGSNSLDSLKQIATGVITALVQSKLGL
nr:MAG TPA: YjcQ protein [Caudoviricetes sp.]